VPEPHDVLLVFLAAREGCMSELYPALATERDAWSRTGAADGFVRIADDPFAAFQPGMRGFDATLELRAPAGEHPLVLEGFAERFAHLAHLDLSAVVSGVEHAFVPGEAGPVRYQYLMRRRHDLGHDAYLAHYRTRHAAIGIRTGGHQGYSQVHSMPVASAGLARAAGLGNWAADSVSRLWIASVEDFLANAGPAGVEAVADEKGFVDGANSVMFASTRLA